VVAAATVVSSDSASQKNKVPTGAGNGRLYNKKQQSTAHGKKLAVT